MVVVRILVIGSGAREHALLVALAADPAVTELHAAPGNPGMVQAQCHELTVTDPAAVTALAVCIGGGWAIVGLTATGKDGVLDAIAGRRLRPRARPAL